jgi:uncharacterized protein YycO
MKLGSLIFVHGTDFISREIEEVTKSKYSHVCIYVGNGKVIEAQGFRTVGYQDLSFYNGMYDVFPVSMSKFDYAKGYSWLKRQLGRKYDYWDILVLWLRCKFKLHIPWHEGKRIICSRLARDFLFKCGFDIPDENMTPEDLYEWCVKNLK